MKIGKLSDFILTLWRRIWKGEAKLDIEEFGSDLIGLIMARLPCTERYNLYSILGDRELKKAVKSAVLPRYLTLRYEFMNGTVECEEEGWKVGFCPLVWKIWSRGTWLTWSSSGGLVAALVDQQRDAPFLEYPDLESLLPEDREEILSELRAYELETKKDSPLELSGEELQHRLAVLVTNVVTGSSRSLEIPCLSSECRMALIRYPGKLQSHDEYYLSIVLDCDPQTQRYKVVIVKVEPHASSIHVYSSETDMWEKHTNIFKNLGSRITCGHAVRSGFLHYSARDLYTHLFCTLNMADVYSPHTQKMIYHRWKVEPESHAYINIVLPIIFGEEYVVAFGSETKYGPISLFKWDAVNGWCKMLSLPMEKVMEFLSNRRTTYYSFEGHYMEALTFSRGNKVGMMLFNDPDYGLEYDMDLKCCECIFDPSLRVIGTSYAPPYTAKDPSYAYLRVSPSLAHA